MTPTDGLRTLVIALETQNFEHFLFLQNPFLAFAILPQKSKSIILKSFLNLVLAIYRKQFHQENSIANTFILLTKRGLWEIHNMHFNGPRNIPGWDVCLYLGLGSQTVAV